MSDLVRQVRQKIPRNCQDTKLSRNGCRIRLERIASRIIVDMDCKDLPIASNQPRCDYIFVGRENWVVPMELKRGNVEANEVTMQLRAGAAFAERIVPSGADVRFRPVVGYGGKLHRSQSQALKRKGAKIRFQGKEYEVRAIRCDRQLEPVLR